MIKDFRKYWEEKILPSAYFGKKTKKITTYLPYDCTQQKEEKEDSYSYEFHITIDRDDIIKDGLFLQLNITKYADKWYMYYELDVLCESSWDESIDIYWNVFESKIDLENRNEYDFDQFIGFIHDMMYRHIKNQYKKIILFNR